MYPESELKRAANIELLFAKLERITTKGMRDAKIRVSGDRTRDPIQAYRSSLQKGFLNLCKHFDRDDVYAELAKYVHEEHLPKKEY